MVKRNLQKSFNDAIEGLIHAIRTQRNMKIHVLAAILVIMASLALDVSRAEFFLLLISITLVISAELMNTALEAAMDATTNHYHPLIKVAKNTAAAAVLVTAVNAVGVGVLIFWEPLTAFTWAGLKVVKSSSPYFTFAVLAIVTFVVLYIKARVGEGTPLRGGMPSGHTAVGFALATMVSYLSGDAIVVSLAFCMALIVAQSRMETRIHTFWEIAAGALVGFTVTIVLFRLFGH